MSLVDKIRKARSFTLSVGDYSFVARRPTDAEAAELRFASMDDAVRGLVRFISDWTGVKERDLFPESGSGDPVPFDPEVCEEWLVDRPDLWDGFVTGILDAYEQYRRERDAAGKI